MIKTRGQVKKELPDLTSDQIKKKYPNTWYVEGEINEAYSRAVHKETKGAYLQATMMDQDF